LQKGVKWPKIAKKGGGGTRKFLQHPARQTETKLQNQEGGKRQQNGAKIAAHGGDKMMV